MYTFLSTPVFTLPSQKSLPRSLICIHTAVASIAVLDNAFMQNSGHCDKAGAGGYNETTFVQTADALVRTGLADLGYVYLNLDDCWIAENRTADGKLTYDLSRFPSGMTWLAKQAHSRKLKLGLYAAASVETCRQFPGSQGHEEVDAQTFADWGADFAKLDSCGGTLANGTESWYHQYGRWADAMNKTGRQMVFSCSWAVYFTICAAKYPVGEWEEQCGRIPWEDDYISDKCHMWRYGEDLAPIWGGGAKDTVTKRILSGSGGSGVGDIIEFASSVFAYNWRSVTGPGAFNDPDFLVVGCPTDRPCEGWSQKGQTPLTDVEQRTQFSMWCLLQAPLIIGSDIRSISATALKTLSNKAAIAINQDPAAYSPKVISKTNSSQVWVRHLHNGDVAVAMINTGDVAADITLLLSDVVCTTCPRKASITDLWAGVDSLGSYGDNIRETVSGASIDAEDSYTAKSVEKHETILLRLTLSAVA